MGKPFNHCISFWVPHSAHKELIIILRRTRLSDNTLCQAVMKWGPQYPLLRAQWSEMPPLQQIIIFLVRSVMGSAGSEGVMWSNISSLPLSHFLALQSPLCFMICLLCLLSDLIHSPPWQNKISNPPATTPGKYQK